MGEWIANLRLYDYVEKVRASGVTGVCVCVCECVCVCVCTYIMYIYQVRASGVTSVLMCSYKHTHTHTNTRTCTYIFMHIHVCILCISVRVHTPRWTLCVYVCVSVCLCPSYLNSYIVFASHQVRSFIHHIEYNSAFLNIDMIYKNNSILIKMS